MLARPALTGQGGGGGGRQAGGLGEAQEEERRRGGGVGAPTAPCNPSRRRPPLNARRNRTRPRPLCCTDPPQPESVEL